MLFTIYGFNNRLYTDWWLDDVYASITDTLLNRGSGSIAKRIYIDKDCYLKSIGVISDSARTSGTLTVEIAPNGNLDWGSVTAVLDSTNTTMGIGAATRGTYYFASGTYFEITVTTSSDWLPVTADIIAWIELEY